MCTIVTANMTMNKSCMSKKTPKTRLAVHVIPQGTCYVSLADTHICLSRRNLYLSGHLATLIKSSHYLLCIVKKRNNCASDLVRLNWKACAVIHEEDRL